MVARLYEHLDEDAHELLDADVATSVSYIQRDRFIPYHPVETVLNLLDGFVRRPASIRPPCLALVGDAGSGKSTLVREFERRLREPKDPSTQVAVYFVADAHPDIPILQRALMLALDIPAPLSAHRQRWVADDLIQRALVERATRLVIIDEVQHVSNLKARDRARTWDWVKWISTANRVSIVCTGISGFESMIREEGQLETRFTIAHLPRWTPGVMFGQFLTAFERSLPLKFPSGLAHPDMQEALLRESALKQRIPGITHGIKQVIEHAAIEAIESGVERITMPLLWAWRNMFEPLASTKRRIANTMPRSN
jgi:type II secretory pathway predicted ATPase ExeA